MHPNRSAPGFSLSQTSSVQSFPSPEQKMYFGLQSEQSLFEEHLGACRSIWRTLQLHFALVLGTASPAAWQSTLGLLSKLAQTTRSRMPSESPLSHDVVRFEKGTTT